MRCAVEMIGWGIYRIDGKTYVWDDYPDDSEHEGYGVMVSRDGEKKEIVKIWRDPFDYPEEMELVDFEWEDSK